MGAASNGVDLVAVGAVTPMATHGGQPGGRSGSVDACRWSGQRRRLGVPSRALARARPCLAL